MYMECFGDAAVNNFDDMLKHCAALAGNFAAEQWCGEGMRSCADATAGS